jgi:asparagine synthase (glutamine-hydrolysing)
MLTLLLSTEICEDSWQAEALRWRCGQSFIEPFDHVALENYAFADGSELVFIVRERLNGYSAPAKPPLPQLQPMASAHARQVMAEMREWPLHFMMVRLSGEAGHVKATITNGAWATAPVFLLASGAGLRGDWDPVRLYPHLPTKNLDESRLAHFLVAFETPYSAKTLFSDLYMLTERAVAKWQSTPAADTALTIEYPARISAPSKQSLKPGADVLAMFEKIMQQAINRWLTAEAHVMCELSSGLDSGVVAAVCSQNGHKPVSTSAILVPGQDGVMQQARRLEMIERFGYLDNAVLAEDFPPLATDGIRVRQQLIVPWEECYYEAMDQSLLAGIRPGQTVVFTGVGGDELLCRHWDELSAAERQGLVDGMGDKEPHVPAFIADKTVVSYLKSRKSIDKAPLSLTPTSAKEAAAYGGARYLRRGVWPVDPFCTPEVIWFCRSLPESWRNEKQLERAFLTKKGCSENVAFPASTESFDYFMESSLRGASRHTICEAMQDSMLNRTGNIDSALFLRLYDSYCQSDEMNDEALFFYSAAILETTLQCAANATAVGLGPNGS